ncbi:MAG: HAD superfamily hydrolase (TIGR01509 family) [Planctomycetota bacterium]|jgi:HAD superfamily hydrolase (TIGR01509 family)
MTFKTIIFDMDGVLIDSEPMHLEAANEVLGLEGAHLSALDNAEYLGCNEKLYWGALVERFSLANDPNYYIKLRHDVLVRMLREQLPIAAGVVNVLGDLSNRGCKLALASSSGRSLIDHVVDKGGMAEFFEVIASGDEVKNSKPDPEIFLLAAERLGAEPEDCLVFEDSANGIKAAIAAGMTCVRVETATTQGLTFPEVAASIRGFENVDLDGILDLERNRS